MLKIYVMLIKSGDLKLKDVPESYQETVKKELAR